MSNGLITNKYSLLQLEESQKRICATYKLEGQELKNVDKEKDLRVTINKNLNAKDHINNLAGRARAWWANIQVAYSHLEGQNTDNPVSQTKFGICHCSMELTQKEKHFKTLEDTKSGHQMGSKPTRLSI